MTHNHFRDQILNRSAGQIKLRQRTAALWADVWLLIRNKIRVGDDPMFQVVNSECNGVTETDGTEMSRDLEPAPVDGLDGYSQLLAGDVLVRLERRNSL